MKEYGLYESAAVKVQTIKTAIESACLILRSVHFVANRHLCPVDKNTDVVCRTESMIL